MKKTFSIVVLFFTISLCAQDYKAFPMWDPSLPIEQRVNDLVSRLTLEEKVKQMLNATPAIPRLGIPAYDWWNEALHGVARTPFRVTSYPQAIGMAATWDTKLHYTEWPIIQHLKEEPFIIKRSNQGELKKDIWD